LFLLFFKAQLALVGENLGEVFELILVRFALPWGGLVPPRSPFSP
jgi:hypothetical protein